MTHQERLNITLYHFVRRDRLAYLLAKGTIHCAGHSREASSTRIWKDDFLQSRAKTFLDLPGKPLVSDFTEFHATSQPPSLYNLVTAWCDRKDRMLRNSDYVILTTTAERLAAHLVPIVVVDRQPLKAGAVVCAGSAGLDLLKMDIIASGDFRFESGPERKDFAGAEVLAYRGVDFSAIDEIICSVAEEDVHRMVESAKLPVAPRVRRSAKHFFSRGS